MERSGKRLRVERVEWSRKPGDGYLLREVFDLLLREPDGLTDTNMPPTMPSETIGEEKGGEE